jgi:hypothetical protein
MSQPLFPSIPKKYVGELVNYGFFTQGQAAYNCIGSGQGDASQITTSFVFVNPNGNGGLRLPKAVAGRSVQVFQPVNGVTLMTIYPFFGDKILGYTTNTGNGLGSGDGIWQYDCYVDGTWIVSALLYANTGVNGAYRFNGSIDIKGNTISNVGSLNSRSPTTDGQNLDRIVAIAKLSAAATFGGL